MPKLHFFDTLIPFKYRRRFNAGVSVGALVLLGLFTSGVVFAVNPDANIWSKKIYLGQKISDRETVDAVKTIYDVDKVACRGKCNAQFSNGDFLCHKTGSHDIASISLTHTAMVLNASSMGRKSLEIALAEHPSYKQNNETLLNRYNDIQSKCDVDAVNFVKKFLTDIVDLKHAYIHDLSDKSNLNSASLRTDLENKNAATAKNNCLDHAATSSLQATVQNYPECRAILEQDLLREQRDLASKNSDLNLRLASRHDRIKGFEQLRFGMRASEVDAALKASSSTCRQQYSDQISQGAIYNCFAGGYALARYSSKTKELAGVVVADNEEFNPQIIRNKISDLSSKYKLTFDNPNKNDIQMSNGQIKEGLLAAFADWSVIYIAQLSKDGRVRTSIAYFDDDGAKVVKDRWVRSNK